MCQGLLCKVGGQEACRRQHLDLTTPAQQGAVVLSVVAWFLCRAHVAEAQPWALLTPDSSVKRPRQLCALGDRGTPWGRSLGLCLHLTGVPCPP